MAPSPPCMNGKENSDRSYENGLEGNELATRMIY